MKVLLRMPGSARLTLRAHCHLGDADRQNAPMRPAVGLPETGPDDVYEFTCQQTGSVTVTLDGLDCDLDLYVLDSTCDTGNGCEGGANNAGLVPESVSFPCTAGETYLIVVEGAGYESASCAGGQGSYDLDVSPGPGSGCAEDCDNASDDDGDADADCADSDCAADPACGGPALDEQGLCPALVFLPGDVNADGSFDVLDAVVLQRDLALLPPGLAQTCSLRCGNGILESGEDCELGTLDGATCESLGFNSGTLACAPQSCTYDTSGCALNCDPLDPEPVCGPNAHCEPQFDGIALCLPPLGLGTAGAPCTTSADCADIYTCLASSVCVQWCRVGFNDCSFGTCNPTNPPLLAGSPEYGVCF